MPLLFIGVRTAQNPPFFVPDRLENVRHDAPDGVNMVVYDANGIPVFGRVVEGTSETWRCRMTDWVWVAKDASPS